MTKLELFLAANPEIMASKGFLFAAAGDGGDGCGSRECAPDPVEGDGKDNNPSETKPEDPKEGETKPEDPKKPDESEDGKPKEGVSVSGSLKEDPKDGTKGSLSVSVPLGNGFSVSGSVAGTPGEDPIGTISVTYKNDHLSTSVSADSNGSYKATFSYTFGGGKK